MRTTRFAWIVASAIALTAIAVSPAAAGVDIAFDAHVNAGNNSDLFFSISSRYFDREPAFVRSAARLFPRPDDLAVAMFIASHSGKTPDFLFSLRRGGLPWVDVGSRCGVPVDAWFIPVERDPGPPYGRAYGYWRKHQRNPHERFVVSDIDARRLVSARMAHDYYGVPADVAMRWGGSGRDIGSVMGDEYRRRHGKDDSRRVARLSNDHDHDRDDDDQGHKSKDHGHGHGHGSKHDR